MALSHINNGINRTQTAKYLHVSRRMVNEWVKRFNEKGIDGLIEKPRSGRPRALSTEQLEKLKESVVSHAIKPDGGRLKATLVIAYVEQEFGVSQSDKHIPLAPPVELFVDHESLKTPKTVTRCSRRF
jgi:transposase